MNLERKTDMNTVVVTMTLDADRSDEVDRHLREDVAAWARRQPGFVSGQWLRLASGDQGLGVVVFESEKYANAVADGPRSQPRVDGLAWNIESVAVFEVVTSA